MFPIPLQKIKLWLRHDQKFLQKPLQDKIIDGNMEVVPCTQISVHKVWSKAISRINSETPIRTVDINGDNKLDIVIGYGIDEFNNNVNNNNLIESPSCVISKSGETGNCEGGILALNGVTGDTLWQRWTPFTIFSLYCSVDLTGDGNNDCVVAGRGGLILAINGRNGNILWQLNDNLDGIESTSTSYLIDLYTINPIRDLNDDSIADIISVHVEETVTQKSGHIKIISGKTGEIIQTIPTPNREEVFVPLQYLTQSDGTELLLIITGGQNTPGGLYTIRLNTLMQYKGENDFMTIFQSESSGFMVPAVLVDITGDGNDDIIVSSFNSTVYAFNGQTYKIIWSYIFPASESVSSIVPGHFDHDNITDFMIKYNTGPGFPVYYYSQTTVLSGATGKSLLDAMITDSGGPNSLLGGVSISQTFGGDFFLHWQTQCRDKLNAKDAYQFFPDSDVVQQSRADTCLLRYNSSTVLQLYAIARHIEPPGAVIFSTDDLILQLNQTYVPPQSQSKQQQQQQSPVFPLKHPKMRLPKITSKELVRINDGLPPSSIENIEKKRMQLSENMPPGMGYEGASREGVKSEKPYIYLSNEENERNYVSSIFSR